MLQMLLPPKFEELTPEQIAEGNKRLAEYVGWEVTTKAKRMHQRKMQFCEIPFGYFKIHPDDVRFDRSLDLLEYVYRRMEAEIDEVSPIEHRMNHDDEDEHDDILDKLPPTALLNFQMFLKRMDMLKNMKDELTARKKRVEAKLAEED